MSKKNDAAFDAFLADVLSTVPADKRAAIEEVFGTDGVKTKLKDGVLAREDYSRNMDGLKKAQDDLNAKIAEANAAHKRNVDWYADANREYADVKGKLDRYEQTYGTLDGNNQPAKKFLTEEDFAAKLNEALTPRDGQAIDVAVTLTELSQDHRDRFKEKLNTRELIKFATDNRLPLDMAYEKFVGPKVDEQRKKELDEAIAKAREEGAREALANHSLPTLSRPTETYSFETNEKTPRSQHDRVAAAVANFREVQR